MRVLHVINQFSGRAGAELSLRDIVLGTQAPNLRHAVVVLRAQPNQLAGLAEAGVPAFVPDAGVRTTPGRVTHVRRAIRRFRPDLVTTALFDANVAGRIAARLTGVPVLTSLVNTPYVPEALRDRSVNPAKVRMIRRADALLSRHATTAFHAITHVVADAAVRDLGIDRARITVVPRGRDATRLGRPSPARRADARAALGIAEGVPVLINVGRQEAQKGQRYLLEALPKVRDAHPHLVLLLVGRDGNSTPDLQRRIRDLDLGSAVRSLGVRHDVGDLLCAADVFVFPSLYEGLGGAVLEAMALQVPIVASDAPALREVLAGGGCGLVPPRADVPALAGAIDRVLSEGPEAGGRVEAAARRFASTYDLRHCLEGMTALYRQTVDARMTAAP